MKIEEPNIKFFREKKGYSQEYVANELSIRQSTYTRIERNLIKLDVDRLVQISQLLDVDLYFLLTGEISQNFNLINSNSYINCLISKIKIQEQEIKDLKFILNSKL